MVKKNTDDMIVNGLVLVAIGALAVGAVYLGWRIHTSPSDPAKALSAPIRAIKVQNRQSGATELYIEGVCQTTAAFAPLYQVKCADGRFYEIPLTDAVLITNQPATETQK